jgi:hypothetical protein
MSSYKTIHPLSTLSYNVPYDILREKYCKLFEQYLRMKEEINVLKEENKKLRKQDNILDTFNLPLNNKEHKTNINIFNNVNIRDNKNIDIKIDNNIKTINKTKQQEFIDFTKKQPNNILIELSKSVCLLTHKKRKHNLDNKNIEKDVEKVYNLGQDLGQHLRQHLGQRYDKVFQYYKENKMINRIKELKYQGNTIRKIVGILNDEKFKSSTGNCISKGTVENIIKNYIT